jgi:hypothetical protein
VEAVTTDTVDITECDELIRAVISRVWRQYKEFVEFDDLYQEAAIWWYGKGQKYLTEYLTDETKGRISVSVYRHVATYAKAEKAQRTGYEPRDQYRYAPAEVFALIPIALDPDGLPTHGHPEGPSPKGNLAEGGDVLAALIDVRRALDSLPEDDLHFLTLADDCSYEWERVAARVDGGVPDSLRRRHARIAERMARWLSNTLEVDE